MRVLALNPGSSSLRFQALEVGRAGRELRVARLAGGSVAAIGERATARVRIGAAEPRIAPIAARDHLEALASALAWLEEHALHFDGIGVRVVHGGAPAVEAELLDANLLAGLRHSSRLAPLHDRASLSILERLHERSERAVAVYDSAFHADLPPVARAYALPAEVCERHGIRRIGFHGLALRSVVETLQEREVRPPRRLVVAHLGSGCSVTALRGGRSLDTSMGYTPLEGLVMATRSGDVDPALVAVLARLEQRSADEVLDLLNRQSGLLGVSGASGDMRDIERRRAQGDARAVLAFDLFVHRARKYVAAMMAVLAGADAIAFSGGIGENSPVVRAALLQGMEWCGIELDEQLNPAVARYGRISRAGSLVAVHVVGVDEEAIIGRATFELLASQTTG